MRACVLLLLLAGCASPSSGWTRVTGTTYPATDPDKIQLLVHKPASAEVIGHVHAIRGEDFTAMEEARRRAAEIGADAMVRLAKGDTMELWPYEPWSTEFIDAEALRLKR
jgi:hypothetical protein